MTIRPMPRMVRTTVMTRNLVIRPLGPRRNGHNRIDEGLSSIGEICYLVVYLFVDCCTENTFANCIQANERTHCYRVVFTEIDTCSIALSIHSST
jgi:hypothetical protein